MGTRIRVIWHRIVQACRSDMTARNASAALMAAQEEEEARSLAWVMQMHDPAKPAQGLKRR
ncbi:hypothetical protein N5D52_07950 [Pseudomonas sp. GD03860]|uniref:hypothetical protein n=1 Tax=Pseudomonas TaxID=286 RepID=UPI0023640650|nr:MULTISPECIES: hypothetical protein [Pseudomonas]MDD2058635.1 hypothetical protein [Pseudomonas putida]MDH0636868.1 hypothetical protein [Pseudomonas sp. GD03860]